MTFEQFRELFYSTDDKANISIEVVGLIQLFDEISVVLTDRNNKGV